MLVKQGIVEFFNRKDIEYIFQIPGLHTISLLEAIAGDKNVKIVGGRHESNTAFMAEGYARSSEKPGVVLVTPGPGLGNVVSGCMEAFHSDTPLLIIHIGTSEEDVQRGALHGVREPEIIFTHITKEILRAGKAAEVPEVLDRAYHSALSDRKGPVLITIPQKLLEKEIGIARPEKKGNDNPDADLLEQEKYDKFLGAIAPLLDSAKRPLIIGGRGVMNTRSAAILDDLCSRSSIPFLTTAEGKGTLPEDRQWTFGNMMKPGIVKDIITSSDLVIAAGTGLRHREAKRKALNGKTLIHIDVDDTWTDKNYTAAAKCSGNIEKILAGLAEIAGKKRYDWDLSALKQKMDEEESRLLGSSAGYACIDHLRKVLPNDVVLVCDLNNLSYWAEYYYPVRNQRSFLMPLGISSIFYAVPAAIGASLSNPYRPCLAICGDGGALPTLVELATIKKYAIPVVILLENNSSFGVLEEAMHSNYGDGSAMGLTNPDFVGLARSFGVKAKRTKSLKGLIEIFHKDIIWDEPFLIEFCRPVGDLPWKNR